MTENAAASLEKEMNRVRAGARRVDIDSMWGLYTKMKRQEADKRMNDDLRIRKDNRIWADIPRPISQQLGDQCLCDAPTDVPLEKIILDQIGLRHIFGEPWRCRRCGTQFQMGLPPDECPVCGHPSIIKDKTINLRR